ncbi:MAG: SURF1 family protein [Halioglobus sp.]
MSDTGLRFDLEWRISLLTAVLLPFLVVLGFWQLQRADEKAVLATTWELRRHQPPVQLEALAGIGPEEQVYTPVLLTGHFEQEKYFLLDNRIHGGRFGYEVLSPFRLQGTALSVLLNRGWIQADAARLSLPEVPSVPEAVTVSGHIYVPPGSPYLLAEQELESGGWPKRIQAVEMDKLAPLIEAHTKGDVYPYTVRTDIGQAGALTVDWKIVNVSPEKHRGYAVQWFTMAAVLGIFYILRSSNLWQLLSRKRRQAD